MEVHPIKTTSSSMHCSQSTQRDTDKLRPGLQSFRRLSLDTGDEPETGQHSSDESFVGILEKSLKYFSPGMTKGGQTRSLEEAGDGGKWRGEQRPLWCRAARQSPYLKQSSRDLSATTSICSQIHIQASTSHSSSGKRCSWDQIQPHTHSHSLITLKHYFYSNTPHNCST